MDRYTGIIALNDNHALGFRGGLPWKCPQDIKHFRKITGTHPCIMGRRTAESLPGPLSGRSNWVLTHSQVPFGFLHLSQLRDISRVPTPAMIIGGVQLWKSLAPIITCWWVTNIPGEHPADVWFPELRIWLQQEYVATETLNLDDGVVAQRWNRTPLTDQQYLEFFDSHARV